MGCHVVSSPKSRAGAFDYLTQEMVEQTSTRQLLASLGWDSVPSREQTYHEIEERLLLPKERLPEDWLAKYQVWVKRTTPLRRCSDLLSRHWNEQISIPSLLSTKPSPPPTSISFIRSGLSGHVTGHSEAAPFPLHPMTLILTSNDSS
jgi:antiviral helicase SKI2